MQRILSYASALAFGIVITFGSAAYFLWQSSTPPSLTPAQFTEILHYSYVGDIVWVRNKNMAEVTLNEQGINSEMYSHQLTNVNNASHAPHYILELPDEQAFVKLLKDTFAKLPNEKRIGYMVEIRSDITDLIAKWVGFLFLLIIVSLVPAAIMYLIFRKRDRKNMSTANTVFRYQPQDQDTNSPDFPFGTGYPVKLANRTVIRSFDEIACFFAQDNCVYLYDLEGQKTLVDITLAKLEMKLPAQFMRIHRSYIINADHIQEMSKKPGSRFSIQLRDKKSKTVVSGQSYSSRIKELLVV